jgi:hypothetical protein
MLHGGPSLDELWRLAARHHGALKGFVLRMAARWTDPAIRRTANHGIAVLTAMIRRLLHLLALEVDLGPLAPRAALPPIARLAPPRARRHRLRLGDIPRDRCRRDRNPAAEPETPDFARARLLERLAVLADAYRARHRIARRLARRAQSAALRRRERALPPALHVRIASGFTDVLDYIDEAIASKARAPP